MAEWINAAFAQGVHLFQAYVHDLLEAAVCFLPCWDMLMLPPFLLSWDHGKDFVSDLAGWGVDVDGLALALAEETGAEWGFVGDFVLHWVGFAGADDAVFFNIVEFNVAHGDVATDVDDAGGVGTVFDDLGVVQGRFDGLDAAFDEGLLVFRIIVLGVFAQVTKIDGLFQAFGNFFAAYGF